MEVNFLLDFFHHSVHNLAMKVVEKDKLIEGMLKEELNRCWEMVSSLERKLAELPKGSLHLRQKVYSYHYLKFREGGRSISKHIPQDQVEDVSRKLEVRKDYEKEMEVLKSRIRYLEKILRVEKDHE